MVVKIFIVYWIVGLLIVLFNLASDEVQNGFKKDTLAFVVAAVAVSLLYPIAIIRGLMERSRKNESE